MYTLRTITTLILACSPAVHCWGNLGHQTVGFIAQNFVTPATESWIKDVLGSATSDYMAHEATWADAFRYTAAGRFSETFHFVDAHDSPPSSCSVDVERDCGGGGCSVSAMANYTRRVQDTTLNAAAHLEAMRFLIHIVGDMTQPLHDEAVMRGGNEIDVMFDGFATNLHHVWDTSVIEKLTGGRTIAAAEVWARELTGEIVDGAYRAVARGWVEGMDLGDVEGTAVGWAVDANGLVCGVVMPDGPGGFADGEDLGGAYYEAAAPVFSEQVAKGGYRLAAWLNMLEARRDGSASHEDEL